MTEGKVFFTKGSATPLVNSLLRKVNPDKCLCVYAEKSRVFNKDLLSLTSTGAKFVEFADYGKNTKVALIDDDEASIIVVGLSDMIRPSNRCDIRFEYMYNFAKVGCKYVIDHVPFLQEKWRTWYPYGVIDPGILLYPHSYAIESAYRNHQEELAEDDPLEMPWIIERITQYTEIDYKHYFDFNVAFEVHKTTDEQKQGYEKLREKLFSCSTTPTPIIRGLSKYCQTIFPERTLFMNLKKVYKWDGDVVLKMTDLKVDWYLRSEIERVVSETNQLTEGLYDISRKKRS